MDTDFGTFTIAAAAAFATECLVPSTITIAAAAGFAAVAAAIASAAVAAAAAGTAAAGTAAGTSIIRSACIHCLYSTGVSRAAAGTTKALLLLLLQPSYFFCDSTALTNASKLLDPSYEKIAESSAVPCQFQR